MLQNATTLLNSQDLSNLCSTDASICFNNPCLNIYAYLLSIGKTNSSATHHYLIMVPLSNYGNGKTNSSATSFNMKNCSTQKHCMIKRGLGWKNCTVKKLQWICDEKHAMCAWDHWNNIGVNQMQYCNEFATSKIPQICIMCVMRLTLYLYYYNTISYT